jgi:serralysin
MPTFIPAGTSSAMGDTIRGSARTDWMGGVSPTSSPDELINAFIYNYQDTLFGGLGDDLIIGDRYDAGPVPNFAADRLYGGAGDDVIYSDWGPEAPGLATITIGGGGYSYGGDGNDHCYGGGATDNLYGDAGNDVLVGRQGADFISGGTGNDWIYGGDGHDWNGLDGGDGADRIFGGTGNDRIYGGAGSDVIYGDAGNDDISGDRRDHTAAAGDRDTLTYIDLDSAVTVDLANPFQQNTGGGGWDIIQGIERLIGTAEGDRLSGAAFDETLMGGAGNDTLNGRAGQDRLDGGSGRDMMTGGAGADAFVFATAPASANRDVVTDFVAGVDRIVLEDSVFGAIGSRLTTEEFRIGTQARDADDNLIYNPATGALIYDADGAGGQAGITFALIGNGLALTLTDFLMT